MDLEADLGGTLILVDVKVEGRLRFLGLGVLDSDSTRIISRLIYIRC